MVSSSGDTNLHHFLGKPYNKSLGVHAMGARLYAPASNAFLSPDPVFLGPGFAAAVAEPYGVHPYGYAAGNPGNFADPNGEFKEEAEVYLYGMSRQYAQDNVPEFVYDFELDSQYFDGHLQGWFIAGQNKGDEIAIVQGLVEMVHSAAAIAAVDTGGAAVTAGTGGFATPATATSAAVVTVAGAAVMTHGGAVAANALVSLSTRPDNKDMTSSSGKSRLPRLDRTGKVHGELPSVGELRKYDPNELLQFQDELKLSVQKRIEVTVERGGDPGHGERQAAEQALIIGIDKILENQ